MKDQQNKLMFLLFFIAVLTLAIFLIRPFIATLILSAVIAYAVYPLYRFIANKTKKERLSAGLIILILILAITIPLAVALYKLSLESINAYSEIKTALDSGSLVGMCQNQTGVFCNLYNTAATVSSKFGLNLGQRIVEGAGAIAPAIISKLTGIFASIPSIMIQIILTLFAVYYMLVDGHTMLSYLKKALPLKDHESDRVLKHFNDIIYATIYGSIILALIQGLVASFGYLIFGVKNPFITGLLTLLAAFIPFFGVALVWVPVSLSLVAGGLLTDNSALVFKGIGLFVYGLLFVSTIDNILRPRIVGKRSGAHPLLILLGAFGGLALFGFSGIIIGPLILTLFVATFKIYIEEKEKLA